MQFRYILVVGLVVLTVLAAVDTKHGLDYMTTLFGRLVEEGENQVVFEGVPAKHNSNKNGVVVFSVDDLERLVIASAFTPIRAVGSTGNQLVVHYDLTVYGDDQEMMEAYLAGCEMRLDPKSGRLGVVEPEGKGQNLSCTVAYELEIPKGIQLSIENEGNLVELIGLEQDLFIRSRFGKIVIDGIVGNVEIETDFSDGRIENITGGTKVTSRFGFIELRELGDSFNFSCGSGTIRAERVTGKVEGCVEHGNLELGELLSDVTIKAIHSTVDLDLTGRGYDISVLGRRTSMDHSIPLKTRAFDQFSFESTGTVGDGGTLIFVDADFGRVSLRTE